MSREASKCFPASDKLTRNSRVHLLCIISSSISDIKCLQKLNKGSMFWTFVLDNDNK